MLNRYPRHVPGLAELLKDPLLKHITVTDLAHKFEVHPDTVRRWKRTEAPASIRLALWAISCAGLDCLTTEAHNTTALMYQLADTRRAEIEAHNARPHLAQVRHIEAAANEKAKVSAQACK